MIVIRITMDVIPGKHLEMMQTLISMIEPTAKETGCIRFNVFCDIEDKNRFCLLEEWKTRKYLDRHMASRRFGVLLGTKALLREPFEFLVHTVSHSEGIDAIHAAKAKKASISPTDGQRSLIK